MLSRITPVVHGAGTFIGAGSFGKVFKGTWNDMDAAVKVIEHSGSSSSADAVQQEMQLLMSFQHGNIFR
jgi:serine/threonine protein kinase